MARLPIVLCRRADLAATGAKGVTLGTWPNAREIVVLQDGETVRAYENRCPHLMSTLETVPDRFLDEAREHLVCTTHGARFRVSNGLCVSGPCRDDALVMVPVELHGDDVVLASV